MYLFTETCMDTELIDGVSNIASVENNTLNVVDNTEIVIGVVSLEEPNDVTEVTIRYSDGVEVTSDVSSINYRQNITIKLFLVCVLWIEHISNRIPLKFPIYL